MAAGARRVMIVEDEALIGLDIADTLRAAGFEVDGPHATAERALIALNESSPDAALLDVDLGRAGTSEAVGEALRGLGVPFVLLSGNTTPGLGLPEGLHGVPQLVKPVMPDEVVACIASLV